MLFWVRRIIGPVWGSNLPQVYVEEFGFKKHRGKISASVWVRIKIKNTPPPKPWYSRY